MKKRSSSRRSIIPSFCAIVDVFSRILNKGVEHDLTAGLGNSSFSFLNLQFADDTILFFVPHIEKLRNLKLLIYFYENMSGLSISKSMAIWLNATDDQQKEIAALSNCKRGSFPLI